MGHTETFWLNMPLLKGRTSWGEEEFFKFVNDEVWTQDLLNLGF